jgi:hypothetical protein
MQVAQIPLLRFLKPAVAGFILIVLVASCKVEVPPKDTVCIPVVPNDTSSLAKKNHFIPRSKIETFKKEFELVRDSLMKDGQLFIPFSEEFNKAAILRTLEDPKCTGIRIYYGIKKTNRREIRLIIVGIDMKGNDLFYIVRDEPVSVQSKEGGVYGQREAGGNEWGNCKPPCLE